MIIFGSTLSPFVRKTAAFLREKGLDFELQPTGLPNPSPEFCAASPFRKMPAFQDGDYCLADSSAICHYIDAKHPDPQLIPTGNETSPGASRPADEPWRSPGRGEVSRLPPAGPWR